MSNQKVRNLIFDLGGVILNIDPQLTVDALRQLGWHDFYQRHDQEEMKAFFYELERGDSKPEGFRAAIRNKIPHSVTDPAIDEAWSAMILDMPSDRIRYLETLRRDYRLFLLSNTNEIHRIKFDHSFQQTYGYPFTQLFEHTFYSHEMGLRKPDIRIYQEVLRQASLVAEETLFIDDMIENTDAARQVGLQVLPIEPGTLLDYLPKRLANNHA